MTLVIVPPGIIRTRLDEMPVEGLKTRIAVLVSKKCGRAYQRNRVKRITREFYRRNQDEFPASDAVIFSLEIMVDSEEKFKQELNSLLESAKATCKS